MSNAQDFRKVSTAGGRATPILLPRRSAGNPGRRSPACQRESPCRFDFPSDGERELCNTLFARCIRRVEITLLISFACNDLRRRLSARCVPPIRGDRYTIRSRPLPLLSFSPPRMRASGECRPPRLPPSGLAPVASADNGLRTMIAGRWLFVQYFLVGELASRYRIEWGVSPTRLKGLPASLLRLCLAAKPLSAAVGRR